MSEGFARNWTCINRCTVFQLVTIPKMCPQCGSRELYVTQADVDVIERADPEKHIEIENEGTANE